MCVGALLACVSMHHTYALCLLCLQRLGAPRTGVIDDYESRCKCWELNLGPLGE